MAPEAKAYPWEGWVASICKVPPPPETPAGTAGSARVFHAARGFYRYRLIEWGLGQVGALVGLLVTFAVLEGAPGLRVHFAGMHGGGFPIVALLRFLESFAVLVYLVQLPFSFALVHLDYRMRWYIVTDRSLRIREGILHVREQTMTFSNIQNLAVKQGPLQRLFGIEDLQVRTAGGGGEVPGKQHGQQSGAMNMHLGYFRGVDNAAAIRDAILGHLRRSKGAGLGDPEDHEEHPAESAPEAGGGVLEAAEELLAEARALRAAASRGAR